MNVIVIFHNEHEGLSSLNLTNINSQVTNHHVPLHSVHFTCSFELCIRTFFNTLFFYNCDKISIVNCKIKNGNEEIFQSPVQTDYLISATCECIELDLQILRKLKNLTATKQF